jgi:hypothetical protein
VRYRIRKIPGQRYLNEKARRAGKFQQEREEFLEKLDKIRRGQPKPDI